QDILGRDSGIDHEIGAGKTENHAHLVGAKQNGVDVDLATAAVQYRYHNGHRIRAGDDTPDDVGTLVAKEVWFQGLDLDPAPSQVEPRCEVAGQSLDKTGDIALQVFPGQAEAVVLQQLPQRRMQVLRTAG